MGQVTVRFDDYQSGSLPDVCVFTGVPTTDRMTMRTRIVERDVVRKPPGPVFGFFSRITLFENPRAPRNILVGKLPVDADHLIALQRRERNLRIGSWASLILLVVAAAWAQPWSPLLAVASIAALIVAVIARIELRRNVPTPTPIGGGTRVHLANVHDRFVTAVEAEL